ncbi:hypothetical protein JTE90_020082 [Oedothorax gibbosus]|uniref:Uncharacterized protein n=1 Tax=Oedothorax gibbosus TaxID=931172 RepID=A0AAV6UTZ9_9ARAC|nr:hypothetical protein JTE90_020082 [Oedothorax gibbosus]
MTRLPTERTTGNVLSPPVKLVPYTRTDCSSKDPHVQHVLNRASTGMPVMSPGEFQHCTAQPSTCAFCGLQIADRFYLQVADRQWHVSCLKCYSCSAPLDNQNTCYFRDGHIYCKEDYFRQVAVRQCPRCERGVFAADLVMRVRELVYHVDCFTCAFCDCPLPPGAHFGLLRRDNLVYCRPHYEMITREEGGYEAAYPPMPQDGAAPWLMGGFPVRGPPPQGRKGRPRKKKGEVVVDRHAGLSPLDPSGCNLHLSHLDGSQSSPPMSGGGGQRTKRMRTSFKHHQLRTMKSYFAINQNPDAKDLKQLAQKTGLSKRVLQVWFQNARAKWRRNNIKQEGMPGMMGGDHSPNSQLHQGGHMSSGLCSPGATSSYSDHSPCDGMASDGSISTQMGGPTMDFDSSNPMTPLVNHHGLNNPGSVHGGETIMHMTSFNDVF